MPFDVRELEDRVYRKLDGSDRKGLQPGDARDILSRVDQDETSERITKILEQLAEDSMSKADRFKITTSLLQLAESYREQKEGENGLDEKIFELARQAKDKQSTDTRFLDKAITLIEEADDAVFDEADVTRDDAKNFLLDIRNEVEEADQPHGVIVHALNNIGNAL